MTERDNSPQQRDWRGINVRRNRKYEHVVDQLCTRKENSFGKPIFEFNKDFMVFAAMVGYESQRKEEVEDESIQIVLGTYATDEKDGYIYLLALLENEDASMLKDSELAGSVKVFEEYCNGGLSIIDEWLSANPEDLDGTNTLVDKILTQLIKIREESDEMGPIEPHF